MNKNINILDKLQKKILIIFYILTTIIIFLIYKDFGVHIEEKFHRLNGLYWLNYIANIFDLESLHHATELKINEIKDYTLSPVAYYKRYGVILDLPVALIEIAFSINKIKHVYEIKHLLSFLIFLTSSFFFFLILKKRFKDFFICLVGTILFLTTPRIFGDSFLYKDILFLSFLNISLYFLLETTESINNKNLFLLSVFTAIAFCLRIFALFIPFTFLFIIIVKSFYEKNLKYYLKNFFKYLFFFIFFIYIFSPFLWANPFHNFLKIFLDLKKDLIGANIKILYDGNFVYNRYVPEDYLITWILITTPIIILIFFSIGYLTYLFRFLKRFISIKEKSIFNDLWRGKKEQKDFVVFFLLNSIFLLLLIFNSPFYNGWRLVYFFNIFIIYIFIYQINNFLIILKKKIFKKIVFLISITSIVYNIVSIIAYHPFQSLYFNELIINEIDKKYEIDYHGLSGKNFFQQIDKLDNSEVIKIGVASHTPLQRSLEGIEEETKKKIYVVGQEFHNADYIYKNNISEVNPFLNNKYNIPKNFVKVYEFKVNKILIYEIFKRQN